MSETRKRIGRVRDELDALELDALVVWQPQNRRYLSGFTGTTGILAITRKEARMITDSRYFGQVQLQCPDFQLDKVESVAFKTVASVLEDLGVARAGYEADTVTVSELERLESTAPDVTWVKTSGIVEAHRAEKSDGEIALLEAAVELTDKAMDHALEVARPGMSETELAWRLEAFMRENGAEAIAFPTIVAAGENSALPHHRPSGRLIKSGEPIVIDMGAQLEGYCGDLTRTFAIGQVEDPEYDDVYEIVDRANRTAVEGLREGMTGSEADALARTVIAEAGHGDRFGHGLGHGVGLNIHELPRLGATSGDNPLLPGMVMTIEPGIYIPDRFGVRIEDVVVLRSEGAVVLSQAPKVPALPG